jgi:ADP-heptose:LPS heptosyltransferase
MRLIFEDLKNLYKDYSIDWCLPYSFLDAAASHPFVSKVISLQDYNKSNYKSNYKKEKEKEDEDDNWRKPRK